MLLTRWSGYERRAPRRGDYSCATCPTNVWWLSSASAWSAPTRRSCAPTISARSAATASSRRCTSATAGPGCSTSIWPGWPRSAHRLELALPPRAALAELVAQALAPWPTAVEGALRLVCTRGAEDGRVPSPSSPRSRRCRRRQPARPGTTASPWSPPRWASRPTLRTSAPWLLGGAKTLSYAVNMASLRWAQSVGADDVLWVSADGLRAGGTHLDAGLARGDDAVHRAGRAHRHPRRHDRHAGCSTTPASWAGPPPSA